MLDFTFLTGVGGMKAKKITISDGKPWGFKIAGGYELNQPIVVTKVDEDTAAHNSGLRHGDILMSVNGISLKYYVTRQEAVQHIMKSGQQLTLEVVPNCDEQAVASNGLISKLKFW